MFDDFPKTRVELPDAYRKIYEVQYKNNRKGATAAASLSQKIESWLHKKVAKDIVNTTKPITTLEIGAGTLNQLSYEKNVAPYDIIEPFRQLYENSTELVKIRNLYDDISDISTNAKYDRITSIATFEHVLDLPFMIAQTCLLLNTDGCLRVSIPNEGSFLWELGWRLTTGLEFKMKYGLDYGVLMKYEHVNTADEIETVLNYFYKDIKSSVFGINKKIALYRFYECKIPNIEHASLYFKQNNP